MNDLLKNLCDLRIRHIRYRNVIAAVESNPNKGFLLLLEESVCNPISERKGFEDLIRLKPAYIAVVGEIGSLHDWLDEMIVAAKVCGEMEEDWIIITEAVRSWCDVVDKMVLLKYLDFCVPRAFAPSCLIVAKNLED